MLRMNQADDAIEEGGGWRMSGFGANQRAPHKLTD